MRYLLEYINYPTVAQKVLIKDPNLFTVFCENKKVSLNQELTNFLLKDTSNALHVSKACKLTLSCENFDTFIENENRISVVKNLIMNSDLTEKQVRTILDKFNSSVTLLQAVNVSKFNKGKAIKVSDYKNTNDLRAFDQWLTTIIDKFEYEEEILNYLTQTKFFSFEKDQFYVLELLRKFVRFKPHLQDKILKLDNIWFNVSLVDAMEIKNLDLEAVLTHIYVNDRELSWYNDFSNLLARNIFINPHELKKVIEKRIPHLDAYTYAYEYAQTFEESLWFSPQSLLDKCQYRIDNNLFVEPGTVLTKEQLGRFKVDEASLPWLQKQPNFQYVPPQEKKHDELITQKIFENKSVLNLTKSEVERLNDLFLKETENLTTPQWEVLFSLMQSLDVSCKELIETCKTI